MDEPWVRFWWWLPDSHLDLRLLALPEVAPHRALMCRTNPRGVDLQVSNFVNFNDDTLVIQANRRTTHRFWLYLA